MDRALKERVVGAAVLVVFVVLVVPVFLDGPTEEPLFVSESVTLPGQNSQQRSRQTIVLERDRKEPVPASQLPAPSNDAAKQAAEPAPKPPAQDPPAAAVEKVTPVPVKVSSAPAKEKSPPVAAPAAAPTQSATGMWAVQLGSFSKKENADRLAADLRGKGYAAFLSQVSDSGSALHRVRVGPQKDRDSAEGVAAKLAKDGVKGQVVPHP